MQAPPEVCFIRSILIGRKTRMIVGVDQVVEPVKLTGTPPPVTKQYPINKELSGNQLIVENLLTQGVLVKPTLHVIHPYGPSRNLMGHGYLHRLQSSQ